MDKLYENEVISLTLGDWTWNASVTGFINIVGQGNVSCNGSTVEIPVRCLKNFEERYFKYFIDTYEKTLPWYKLVYFKKTIENHRENEFKNLNLQGLKGINTYIKDTAKRYLTGNSIKSAFELMGIAERIQQLEKGLEKIKEPKDEAAFEKEKPNVVEEVKKQFEILNEILEYCGSDSGRRFIGAKNVIYAVIKNGWNGVCFLNPQTKIKDMYEDYRKYFVDEAVNYINSCDKKYKFRCFTCGSPIKDFSNDMSFINQSGFDVARKPSHVWNFTNDIALCPVCKLVYSCLPAGFAYVNDTGLYINANINMLYNIRVNSNVKTSVNDIGIEQNSRKIYRVLVEAMKNQQLERQKYELADVQVVRYKGESYKFNLLPESTIKLINDFSDKIEGLIKTNYKEGKESYSIYELVLEHILNNQNLFLLINKLLHYKISTPNNCFFQIRQVIDILRINVRLVQNLGGMKEMEKDRDLVSDAKNAGYYLKRAYLQKDPNTGKLPGISYRILNALKTGNRNMFMDVVLNCYLYVGEKVPSVITEVLKDEDEIFSTIGYAFVSGLIEGKKDESTKTDNREENNNG